MAAVKKNIFEEIKRKGIKKGDILEIILFERASYNGGWEDHTSSRKYKEPFKMSENSEEDSRRKVLGYLEEIYEGERFCDRGIKVIDHRGELYIEESVISYFRKLKYE